MFELKFAIYHRAASLSSQAKGVDKGMARGLKPPPVFEVYPI